MYCVYVYTRYTTLRKRIVYIFVSMERGVDGVIAEGHRAAA